MPSISHEFKTPPIVEVDWIDSFSNHGWEDRKRRLSDAEQYGAGTCKSVGYLTQDGDEYIRLTDSLSANDNVSCDTCIPKFAIVERRTLRE